MTSRTLALALVAVLAVAGCRKRREAQPSPPPASASAPVVTTARLEPVRVEKFIASRAALDTVELAAVARDRSVILSTLDGELRPITREVLARDVEATEGTEIALVGDGLVVVVAKIGGTPGAWLLRKGSAPLPIGRDRCLTRDGVAWLVREGASARVRLVRGTGETTSPPIPIQAEGEVQLACGPDAITLSVRDGEHLSTATLPADALSSPAVLSEIEREGELDDELRDRLILPRAGRGVVLLRVGESSVAVREIDASSTGAWRKVMRGSAPLTLRDDADLVEAAVAPGAHGRIYFLVSEPTSGSACKDGEPPRRIVLHDVETKGEALVATSRPVIELPCGVEAIAAHLQADVSHATMWWTEPVDAKTCNHPGLSASAIVTAQSDKPGARRSAIVAEGVARVDESRFVAVVRPGKCAPWAAPDAGALVFAPPPK